MSVSIINPGVSGITVETDPTALKLTGGDISGNLTVAQKVGIGGVVPVGATNKLAVHNGNIVFTSGFGVAFGDGTSLASTSPLALKAGTTFTGKVNFSTVSGVAGLNIGIGGTDAANTTAGDMWIATGGASLNFRDGTGAWRQLVNTSGAAGISATSTTHVLSLTQNGNGAGLLITNNGTGNSLVIDNGTPDVAFTINTDGRVGVGVAPSASAAIKVDAGGIMFNDNTSQTTAANVGSITSLAKLQYDKEYLAQNLALNAVSVIWNSAQTEITFSGGEVLLSKVNAIGYSQIYAFTDTGPGTSGIAASSWDGTRLFFPVDLTDGGAATWVSFSVGSTYPVSYYITKSIP